MSDVSHHQTDGVSGDDQNSPQDVPDSKRTRNIIAAIATVAILAVLAFSIFDSGDPEPSVTPTVVDELPSDGNGATTIPEGVELGSLSIAAYACAEADMSDAFCAEGQPIPLENAIFQLDDGSTVSIGPEMRVEDGTYALLNVPVGVYLLQAQTIVGPEGTLLRNVIGPVEAVPEGWRVSNLDPNQPAMIQINFALVEGSPVAG